MIRASRLRAVGRHLRGGRVLGHRGTIGSRTRLDDACAAARESAGIGSGSRRSAGGAGGEQACRARAQPLRQGRGGEQHMDAARRPRPPTRRWTTLSRAAPTAGAPVTPRRCARTATPRITPHPVSTAARPPSRVCRTPTASSAGQAQEDAASGRRGERLGPLVGGGVPRALRRLELLPELQRMAAGGKANGAAAPSSRICTRRGSRARRAAATQARLRL